MAFRTTWDHVFCSVERAVTWGRKHQDLSGIEAIGIDEIAWQRGHRYLTLVYQIDGHRKRLLWIGEKRTIKTLLRFFFLFSLIESKNPSHLRTVQLVYLFADIQAMIYLWLIAPSSE